MAVLRGKLTNKLVENLRPGRHGDGACHYLVVDPFGALRWIVGGTIKGQIIHRGAPPRTDFGLGGADVVTFNTAGASAGMPTHGQLWSGSTFQRAVPGANLRGTQSAGAYRLAIHLEERPAQAALGEYAATMPSQDQMYAGGQY